MAEARDAEASDAEAGHAEARDAIAGDTAASDAKASDGMTGDAVARFEALLSPQGQELLGYLQQQEGSASSACGWGPGSAPGIRRTWSLTR